MQEKKSKQILPSTYEEIEEMIKNEKFDPDNPEPNVEDIEDVLLIEGTIKNFPKE